MTTLTPRQRQFIGKARDAYQAMIDGDMDAIACVPYLREQLALAEVGVDELDPLGLRSAAEIHAEIDAAWDAAIQERDRRWQEYEQDHQAAIEPREAVLESRKATLQAILEARQNRDPAIADRIGGHLDRIDAERRELRASQGLPHRG